MTGQYAVLVLFSVLLAIGQSLFKKAALASLGQPLPMGFLTVWMFAALALYAIATVLWVWLLRSVPLSTAYPFAALGFVLVPLLARVLFGEAIDLRYGVGAALIIVGIVVVSR